ncbi:MAG: diguanylate cyclase [Acidobacteriota bacterium]
MTKRSPKAAVSPAQEQRQSTPSGWETVQDELAAESGLAILLVEGHQPPSLIVSNNNSLCHALQSSPAHVGLCDPYCGDAHRRAIAAGGITQYKCHARLLCFAVPVQIAKERELAVIGGRAFVSITDYRATVERLRSGDLKELLDSDPLQNVIISDEPQVDALAGRVQKAARQYAFPPSHSQGPEQQPGAVPERANKVAEPMPPANESFLELQHEVNRLRGELEHRTRFAESLQNFLERISATDPQQTYLAILKNSKELLLAERASLLVYDESTGDLTLKAGIGIPTEISAVGRIRLGEGISGRVLQAGKPLVVNNMATAGLSPAPVERKYKTDSFISYPIGIAGRKVGVLNVADKRGGGSYDEVDLSLIDIIAPQVALALERAEWQERASAFQLMSITDALTGLLNRRYLEERLNEELNRSRRYEYPMSFLMIDIDDFKRYNDLNGHQAGDLALQMTAHCLKAGLRSEDVACRYGGEEFCILLPQTPVVEAGAIAERMRQRVAGTDYPHGKGQSLGAVTISIGISTFAKHIDTSESVIAAADRALYTAKNKGKNRIEFYQDALVPPTESNEGQRVQK